MSNVISDVDTRCTIVSKIARLFKFVAISYVISFILIVALSAIVCYTDVPESVSTPAVKIITFLGVFVSAFMNAAGATGKGWLVGGLSGIVYIWILLLLGFFFADGDMFSNTNLLQMMYGFAIGVVGGIFGINISGR